MHLHEKKKLCKILDDILLYLIKQNCKDFKIDFKIEDKMITYIIETNKLDPKIQKFMLTHINQKRELEIEEYAWELLGEYDTGSDLNLVSLLIDNLEIINKDDVSILKMVRYN